MSANNKPQFEKNVKEMFETFITADSPLAINIDHNTRMEIMDHFKDVEPSDLPENIFDRAQSHVYRLMEKDCFSRFIHSDRYKEIAKRLNLPMSFSFHGCNLPPRVADG
ncbi:hypothetical protein AB6A40_009787 [Gnathostoma spinigerum]|uniref:RGS domain-containing protein n=1 Tax=Gnathostoma spinigerum TaxID=75299 RepID=A0ABD6ESZ6_9BILA